MPIKSACLLFRGNFELRVDAGNGEGAVKAMNVLPCDVMLHDGHLYITRDDEDENGSSQPRRRRLIIPLMFTEAISASHRDEALSPEDIR